MIQIHISTIAYVVTTLIYFVYFYANEFNKMEQMDDPRAYWPIAFGVWAAFTLIFGGIFWW